ncbi:MAG: glycosyltransferase family 4 protein [Duncaniella sp.]|nr:glycosyltransferase family 4 protein [Duncaniella sp.]
MLIGFDAKKIVSNLTGIGNYSRGLVNLLSAGGEDKCVLFAPDKGNDKCLSGLDMNGNVEFVYSGSGSGIGKNYWRNFSMVNDIKRSGVDLFHGVSNELPFGIAKAGCKTAVTIHDLIFIRYPHTYDFLSRKILEVKTRYACRVADRIIAVSEQTKRDIVEFYGVAPEKIDVLYQGCHAAFKRRVSADEMAEVRRIYDLPERYMVSVGTIEERKNHRTVVDAVSRLTDDVPLLIVSKRTRLQRKIEEQIEQLGLGDRVKIINGVPFNHLPALYQGSELAIYLSYFEGFGIPVLEGITSGVPVIAATGSCLEEAGGKGAVYCDPFDAAGVAEAMHSLLTSPERRGELVAEGEKHIAAFTDEVLSENIRAFYEKLLRGA